MQIMKAAAWLLGGIGFAIMWGAVLYHLIQRPEWTQAQALRIQWVPLVSGFFLIVTGMWLHGKSTR